MNVKEKRRQHHHYHRDGTVTVKPSPKKRRHHRRKIRVTDDINDDILSLQNDPFDNTVCYYIGGRIGATPYHHVLDEHGNMSPL